MLQDLDRRLVQNPTLALPWPYTLPRNTELAQQITLSLPAPSATPRTAARRYGSTWAPAQAHCQPSACLCAELATASAHMAELTPLRPRHLIYHFDPRASADPEADLRQAANIAHGLSAEPWLEAVVALRDRFRENWLSRADPHRLAFASLASPAAALRATPAGQLPGPPRRHCPHFTEPRARPCQASAWAERRTLARSGGRLRDRFRAGTG